MLKTVAPGLLRTHASVWGYVGAQDIHLQKYTGALHALGVPTVYRRTVPTLDAFFAPSKLKAIAEQWLLQVARESPGTPHLVWLLSNGGAFIYYHSLALLHEDASLPLAAQRFSAVSISAVCYDSCPAWVTPLTAANALTTALGLPARPLLNATLHPLLHTLFACTMYMPPIKGLPLYNNTNFFADLARDVAGLPGRALPRTLVVYSADDSITLADKVEAFAAACSATAHPEPEPELGPWGSRVRLLRMPSPSPHCTHLRTHRELYTKHLAELLA